MDESPWTDLDRPPLNAAALGRALVRPGSMWRQIRVVAETGSTNADLVAAAREGAEEGIVLVAEGQTRGRGRLDRAWSAPPRSGLTFSVLLRPRVPAARLGWVPPLTGVAVASAVRAVAGIDARLKWPNDVLVGERKLAGILVERSAVSGAVIVGVGLNVSLRAAELPVPTATSLALEDAECTDRDPVLRAVVRELDRWYTAWTGAGGDPRPCGLRDAYATVCATLDREVRVELPGGRPCMGVACDVDEFGRLVVRTDAGDQALSAGDVIHVR